jgi:hypothetical protein
VRRGVGLALACVGTALEGHAAPVVLYTRATPIDTRTGVVAIRTVQEALADAPVDCAGAEPRSFGCWAEGRFTRVYGLEFSLERRDARGATPSVEVEPRGQAYVFLHLERDDLAAFDDELRRSVAALAPDAFVDPFAGLEPQGPPFSGIARVTPEPSWSCFEDRSSRVASVHDRQVTTGPDGKREIVSSGTTTSTVPERTLRLCDAGSALVRAAAPEDVRTMPSARAIREETVAIEFVDRIPATARAEDLVPFPDAFSYTVREAPGVSRSSSHRSEDSKVTASFAKDGVRIGAEVAPAAFPPHVVAMRGWLARWTVETIDRELGAQPTEKREQALVLRSALVATRPPTPVDPEGQPTGAAPPETVEPRFDATAYVREIASRLDRVARLDGDTLARVIVKDPAGLGSSGFVLFICRERSATFEILPTGAGQQVTNAGELCAAIDRALDRS